MTNAPADRRAAIEAAFRRLLLLEGKETCLQSAVGMLADVNCIGSGAIPTKFSMVGRNRTRMELKKLAKPDSDLMGCLDALHHPAILALANMGFIRGQSELPGNLREVAKRASETDLGWVLETVPGGRPENKCAHAVGTMLAYHYHMLTGEKPTRRIDSHSDDSTPHGPFMDLVNEVFAIMGLRANTEDVARAAIERHNLTAQQVASAS